MAVVYVQEFAIEGDDRSTTNYDAVSERLGVDADPPAGLIVHTAGFDKDAGVFRIMDVWETKEDVDRFMHGRVMPIVQELMAGDGAGAPPSREGSYELHHIVNG